MNTIARKFAYFTLNRPGRLIFSRYFSTVSRSQKEGTPPSIIPKKILTKLEAEQREQWHLRQKAKIEKESEDDGKTKKLSANKLFKKVPVDPQIMNFLRLYDLGREPAKKNAKPPTQPKPNIMSEILFQSKFQLFAAAGTKESFPPETLPEVAFIGRSNVGKSSLINALTNSQIVRTSDKPGETQILHWFHLGDRLALIDLPGYGFAFAKPEKIEAWTELIRYYLDTRKALKRAILLVDARHSLKKGDYEMMDFLEKVKTTYQIVLTKSDLVLRADLARRIYLIKKELQNRHCAIKTVIPTSALKKKGITLLRSELLGLALPLKSSKAIDKIKPKDKDIKRDERDDKKDKDTQKNRKQAEKNVTRKQSKMSQRAKNSKPNNKN
jgi:ribosome biogenesis GTP-binding protein YsxC/EngB